jgi:predicted MFS family arabinose efflux permease
VNETFWAGTSYLLTSSTFQPVLSALSEVFGRKKILLLSILLFTFGTLIACLATNFPTLLAGRTIQGIGGGGIITLNLVIMTDIIPLRERPKYNGMSQMAWALGTIVGPLVGGTIAQKASWRLLFYLNFPFCVIGLVAVPFVVRLELKHRLQLKDILNRIDWIGSALFLGGTTSFLVGITGASNTFPWNSYQTLVPLILGVAGIFATGIWELRYANIPFIRRTMLRSRSLMTAYFCTILQGLVLYAHMYYIALYLLTVKSRSPILTGVAMLPISCGLAPAAALVGVAISRLGTWKWAVWLGWTVNSIGAGLLILLNQKTPTAAWTIIFLVIGVGQGLLLSAHNFAVQTIAGANDAAYATALFAFMRGVGLCLGVAIGGMVFQNQLQTSLDANGIPINISNDPGAFLYILELLTLPVSSSTRIQVISAFLESFRFLFEVLAGICCAGLLLSLTITGKFSLDRALQSEHMLRERTKKNAEVPEL